MTILCNSHTQFLPHPSPNSKWSNTHEEEEDDDNNNNINHHPTMTSPHEDDDDDSWEIRAFEEDTTGNLLGCTWPPRSYTCSFCRREFRSAQALGGHMNVHRRDRARLHQAPPPAATHPPLLIQANGLCLFYPSQNPNSGGTIIFPTSLPIPKPSDTAPNSVVLSVCHSSNTEPSASNSYEQAAMELEELDLELRLGRSSTPASSAMKGAGNLKL